MRRATDRICFERSDGREPVRNFITLSFKSQWGYTKRFTAKRPPLQFPLIAKHSEWLVEILLSATTDAMRTALSWALGRGPNITDVREA